MSFEEVADTIPLPSVAGPDKYHYTPKLRVFNPGVELHEHLEEVAAASKDSFKQGLAAGALIGFVLGALII